MSWKDEPITWPQYIKLYDLCKWRFVPESLHFQKAVNKIVRTKGEASVLIKRLSEKPPKLTDEQIEQIVKEIYNEQA